MAFMALWGRAALSPSPLSLLSVTQHQDGHSHPRQCSILLLDKWESVYLPETPRSDDCVGCPTGRRLRICDSRYDDYTVVH